MNHEIAEGETYSEDLDDLVLPLSKGIEFANTIWINIIPLQEGLVG